jgi:hypothetical protein
MSAIERDQLLKAAKAVRAAQGAREAREAPPAQLELIVRSSPVWAAVPNPPAAGEPITTAHLEAFVRNCQIADALGIES